MMIFHGYGSNLNRDNQNGRTFKIPFQIGNANNFILFATKMVEFSHLHFATVILSTILYPFAAKCQDFHIHSSKLSKQFFYLLLPKCQDFHNSIVQYKGNFENNWTYFVINLAPNAQYCGCQFYFWLCFIRLFAKTILAGNSNLFLSQISPSVVFSSFIFHMAKPHPNLEKLNLHT